jgi:hypothetical protein
MTNLISTMLQVFIKTTPYIFREQCSLFCTRDLVTCSYIGDENLRLKKSRQAFHIENESNLVPCISLRPTVQHSRLVFLYYPNSPLQSLPRSLFKTVGQGLKKFPTFKEPDGLLSFSKQSVTGPHPELDKFGPNSHTKFYKIHLISIIPSKLTSLSCSFHQVPC